jgi:uncharacterized membrane protein YcaP (DUF421 family)
MNVFKFNLKQLENAILKANGLISVAAKILNCDNKTIYNYIDKYPTLKDTLQEARNKTLDLAENKLFELINEKDKTAIIFFLKTIGRGRGYIERFENVVSKGENEFEIPKTPKQLAAYKAFIKAMNEND